MDVTENNVNGNIMVRRAELTRMQIDSCTESATLSFQHIRRLPRGPLQ